MPTSTATCSCTWETQHGVNVLARRDVACPAHGDDTGWAERIQRQAERARAKAKAAKT